jgi:hypothetical protein
MIKERILRNNECKVPTTQTNNFITFVRAGTKPHRALNSRARNTEDQLFGINDWQYQFDYDHKTASFPISISATEKRPDIVIWSTSARKVIIGELTVPAEEEISNAHNRKLSRYESLVADCIGQGWQVTLLPFEVGCKGFVGYSFVKFCKNLGFPRSAINNYSKLLSRVALRCSYLIYLSRNNRNWKPINLHITDYQPHFIHPNDALLGSDISS